MSEQDKCQQRMRLPDGMWVWCTRMKNHEGQHRNVPERGAIIEFKDDESFPVETRNKYGAQP